MKRTTQKVSRKEVVQYNNISPLTKNIFSYKDATINFIKTADTKDPYNQICQAMYELKCPKHGIKYARGYLFVNRITAALLEIMLNSIKETAKRLETNCGCKENPNKAEYYKP